jgi:CRP-like cAMP-binding protein
MLDISPLVRAVANHKAHDALVLPWSSTQWERFGSILDRRELATGDLLVHRGARDTQAYLLESGQLQVFVSGGPPGSHRIATLSAGAIVGEPVLFVDAPRSASVEALTPCVVWALVKDSLDALAHTEPQIALAFLRAAGAVMAVRMRANLERGIPTT